MTRLVKQVEYDKYPGLSPQDIGKPLLRKNSTQMMRKRKKKKVTKGKWVMRDPYG